MAEPWVPHDDGPGRTRSSLLIATLSATVGEPVGEAFALTRSRLVTEAAREEARVVELRLVRQDVRVGVRGDRERPLTDELLRLLSEPFFATRPEPARSSPARRLPRRDTRTGARAGRGSTVAVLPSPSILTLSPGSFRALFLAETGPIGVQRCGGKGGRPPTRPSFAVATVRSRVRLAVRLRDHRVGLLRRLSEFLRRLPDEAERSDELALVVLHRR